MAHHQNPYVASLLLTVLPSPTRPLLSPTSLLHASCALGRRRFHPLQLCATQRQSTTDVSSAAAAAREHMIDKQNDVLRLECPTPPVLQQGLIETAQLPHICIAGESNAGKSQLINHLLNKKSLAEASSVAGKTKSVDMMLVNEQVCSPTCRACRRATARSPPSSHRGGRSSSSTFASANSFGAWSTCATCGGR